ncbi:hypothetical protein BJV82DRAFT_42384 [Fennellomyces sp. T-0311]|nr:hypothetical protein BJV82DRAFT_42384 [Fennellomyces sp. T-0311]
MEDDFNVRKTSQYSRPIDFIRGTDTAALASIPQSSGSTGDQVASLYSSIVSTSDSKSEKEEKIWCPDCEIEIAAAKLNDHLKGTAHLVSGNRKTPTEFLALDGRNVGFRLLRAQGWKYEEGLGAKGEGRRHPIATSLKQDKFGLGHSRTAPKRVTHTYQETEEAYRQKKPEPKAIPSGKMLARQARRDARKRAAMLHYLNN